jgi:hypothetical protein
MRKYLNPPGPRPGGLLAITYCLFLFSIFVVAQGPSGPSGCPAPPNVNCCSNVATTTQSQTFPPGANIHVNIDPAGFPTTAERAAIEKAYLNWQSAGGVFNNGSGVNFTFTYSATPLSMTPPAGTYNIQVWHQPPPEAPEKAGGNDVVLSGGRVVAQEVWISLLSN